MSHYVQAVVAGGHNYTNLTTDATTVIKTGRGVIHTLSVGVLGTAPATIILHDNTAGSGTIIGTFTTSATANWVLDAEFLIGLTAITASGATDAKITITWR